MSGTPTREAPARDEVVRISRGHEHRILLMSGMKQIARAVGSGFGPRRGPALEGRGQEVMLLRDGAAIAAALVLDEPVEELGAEILRAVGRGVAAEAGDGTSTAILLADQVYRRAVRAITAGAEPQEVGRGMVLATQLALVALVEQTRTATEPDLLAVATLAAGGDRSLGELAVKAVLQGADLAVVAREDTLGDRLGRRPRDTGAGAPPSSEAPERVVILAGGATAAEASRRKVLAEKAVAAVVAARSRGVVAGGGLAYLRAAGELASMAGAGDRAEGWNAVRRALEQPLRQLAANAGEVPRRAVDVVTEGGCNRCLDAFTGALVEPTAAGILDAVGTLETALRHAASLARLLACCEVAIAIGAETRR
ncbi:MAG TPA: TCP-1/cpn60 chaperonin family protein [Thermoanaerobaculia bacterium]|nr:TCP-1/cpn60 chaperonin family protein [Thermoanaerobaculia bacterium]